MTFVALLLLWTLRSVAAPAYADHYVPIDREILYGWCKPYALGDSGVGHLCAGYISAISDIFNNGLSIDGYRACIPEHVSLINLRAVVFERLENRPKNADEPGYDWVVQALALHYPCN